MVRRQPDVVTRRPPATMTGCGKPVATIFGMLARAETPPRSIEELADAAAAGWAGDHPDTTVRPRRLSASLQHRAAPSQVPKPETKAD